MSERPLFPPEAANRTREALVLSGSHQTAWETLCAWRTWPGGALALIGPKGAGKSHMAEAWAAEVGAAPLTPLADADQALAAFRAHKGLLFLEDCDRGLNDEGLFFLLDLVRTEGGAVLLTARAEPPLWPARSPDLNSRLRALVGARLRQPDLFLLKHVLQRLCRNRFMNLPDRVADYLVRRMERSFETAQLLAEALERVVDKPSAPLHIGTARLALSELGLVDAETANRGNAADE